MTKKVKIPPVNCADDGKARHPLLALHRVHGPTAIGRVLGHKTSATVSIYVRRAKQNRNALVPAEWVLPLCRAYANYNPCDFRPDLYLPGWKL